MRAAFCLTCCAGLLFAGARRTVQSGRDRPLGSLIRRCSVRRDLWNKVPSPARTRPASARADALTARGCSHRHWIGRRRGGHHHVHNPPWPPPPRASAAYLLPKLLRHAALHHTAPHRDWSGMCSDACARAQGRTLLKGRGMAMGANAALWHSLHITYSSVCRSAMQ